MAETSSDNPKHRPALLLFDVNETLLDMAPMRAAVNEAFGTEQAFNHWFYWLLHYSLVENVTGSYHDFAQVGQAVMQMTAQALSRDIPEAWQKKLLGLTKALPPHPDVVPGLQQLQQAGYRMATLSNSPAAAVSHLEQIGLSRFFSAMLSVDLAQKFKPAPETYQAAAAELQVPLSKIMLVSTHGWDVAGALRAGARAAFIARPGQALFPLAPLPELQASSLPELAQQLQQLH